jgi:FkbM family methyltransferase
MSLRELVRRQVMRLLSPVSRRFCGADAEAVSAYGMFERIARRGHEFATVIDVGASNGMWSQLCMRWFPRQQYLLIEAQPCHEAALVRFARRHGNAAFVLAAAGEAAGRAVFRATSPLGGSMAPTLAPLEGDAPQCSVAPAGGLQPAEIVVPVTTVDAEVRSRQLPGPYLLKLDTHGHEEPILRGCAQVLQHAELIIVECYLVKLSATCLRFDEMCQLFAGLGFRCVDLSDPLWRGDGALWQVDLVFARADWPGFGVARFELDAETAAGPSG